MPVVAYIANKFPSPVEPYVQDEIRELRRRGVTVIATTARRPKFAASNSIFTGHKSCRKSPGGSLVAIHISLDLQIFRISQTSLLECSFREGSLCLAASVVSSIRFLARTMR